MATTGGEPTIIGGERLRLFVAIPLTDEVRDSITRLQRGLKTREWPVRWVRPELTHITLKFLGDTSASRIPELRRRLAIVAGRARPVVLATAGIGAFPSVTRPKVIWLGLSGEVANLERLAADVEGVTGGKRASAGDKPFRAHITLGRARDDAKRIDDFAKAAEEYGSAPEHVPIDTLQLIRSVLGPQGSTYTTISEWELGPREPADHG